MKNQIRDLMTRDVVTLDPEMTLRVVNRELLRCGVSGAPVVEKNILVGVVSQTDVVRFLFAEQTEASKVSGYYTSPFPIPLPALEHLAQDTRKIADHMTKQKVREIMSTDVRSVAPEDDVQTVAATMASEGFHRMPVVNRGELVGIVTSMDLVRRLGELGLGEG